MEVARKEKNDHTTGNQSYQLAVSMFRMMQMEHDKPLKDWMRPAEKDVD